MDNWRKQKEQEIRDFLYENPIEYSWRNLTLYVHLRGSQMEDFGNILSKSLFDEGGIDCNWNGDYITINMTDINNTFLGINLYNVFDCDWEFDVDIYEAFWEFIEKINWEYSSKNNPNHYQTIQRRLKDYFSPFLIKKFREIHNKYVDKLYHKCKDYCQEMDEDAYINIRSYIVAMGHDMFYKVLNNPELILDYKDKYNDSFGYCFYVREDEV